MTTTTTKTMRGIYRLKRVILISTRRTIVRFCVVQQPRVKKNKRERAMVKDGPMGETREGRGGGRGGGRKSREVFCIARVRVQGARGARGGDRDGGEGEGEFRDGGKVDAEGCLVPTDDADCWKRDAFEDLTIGAAAQPRGGEAPLTRLDDHLLDVDLVVIGHGATTVY